MTLSDIWRRAQKVAIDNSPAILTAIGVTGTLATAYLAGVAGFKAAEILSENENMHQPLTTKEKVQLTWKMYIPAIGTGALTVVCIFAANRIGSRRAAAIAAAYSISEKAFGEYREKIVEKLGQRKELAARDEIAQDQVTKNPPNDKQIVITDGGSVLCKDAYSGRYFLSDMDTLRKAENHINHRIIHDIYVSLSDFYELIGLDPTSNSDEVGWNADKLLEIHYSTTLSPLGKPCIVIDYGKTLIRSYDRLI